MAKPVEISGVLRSAKWPVAGSDFFVGELQQQQSGNGEPIGKMLIATSTVKLVGNSDRPDDESSGEGNIQFILTPQCSYRFFGQWSNDDKWGQQFKFTSFVPVRPHTQAGVVKYLQQCPGIGIAIARALWNQFRGDAVRIVREQPEVAAAAVSGLTEEKAKKAAEVLEEMATLEDCSIELMGLLDGRGFPKKTAMWALKRWGNRATSIIERYPPVLMGARGCGWKRCDAMYLDLGHDPAKMKRQVLCVWYSLASDNGGHVWYSKEHAERYLRAEVSGAKVDFDRALQIGCRHGIITQKRDCFHCGGTGQAMIQDLFLGETYEKGPCPKCNGTGGKLWIAEKKNADAEDFVARKLAEMTTWEANWPSLDDPAFSDCSDHQKEKALQALSGAAGSLGGSPGSGKTFLMAAIVKATIQRHGIASVMICAPTGKAAIRCGEAIRRYGINVEPKTIHRTLGVMQAEDDSGTWSFRYNQNTPLPCKFLFIDESSMCGLSLTASLLKAVARGTNVLFVGDVNQLLPVEFGAPLRDMTAHIPYGELTEIRRNAGTIVRACAEMRDGKQFSTDAEINTESEPPRNLKFIFSSKESTPREIISLVKRLRDSGKTTNPITDIQVVVAVNKRSPLCREKMNSELQDIMNPNGKSIPESPFRVDDKVIVLKNSFLNLVDPFTKLPIGGDDNKTLIANGEFGVVVQIEKTKTIVQFENPKRMVVITRYAGKQKDEKDKHEVKERPAEGKEDEVSATGCDMDLGYAVSCHKMQGSSAPIVAVAIDDYPGASGQYGICDRSWLYTAVSRAELECYLVGRRATADFICRRQFIQRRKTFTSELLAKYIAEKKAELLLMSR